ncbi:MAG: PQQ-binding-like beta-propeller repeat protein, partial [Tepidiformaceae bacterium]
LADGVLYFGTTEGKVYAVTAATGKFAPGWEKPLSFGDGVWAPPVVAAGTLYIATMDGELHALGAADRREKWARPFKTEGAIPSLTLLDAGHLFVPTLAKKVFIVETATGEAPSGEFRASDWVWTRPAFAQGVAYFADLSGTIYALDITSGRVKWTTSAGGKVKSGPAIVDDVLVLVDREPVVHFLTLDGALRNTVPILGAGTVRADVTAGEAGGPFAGKALIATTKGKLFEADPRGSVVEIPVAGAP